MRAGSSHVAQNDPPRTVVSAPPERTPRGRSHKPALAHSGGTRTTRLSFALCMLAVGACGGFALRGTQVRYVVTEAPPELGPTAPHFEPIVPREVVQRGIVSRGARWRSKRLVDILGGGEPVVATAIGGSITYGHHATVTYPNITWEWLNATYPNPDHDLTNEAVPATTSTYFGPCVDAIVPHNATLVLVELLINDGDVEWRHARCRSYERLLRALLSRPEPPLVVPIMMFSYHMNQHDGVFTQSPEGSVATFSLYYELPWLSTRQALFHSALAGMPNTTTSETTKDGVHLSSMGHRIVADIVIEYIRGEVAFHSAPPPPPPPPPPPMSPLSPSPADAGVGKNRRMLSLGSSGAETPTLALGRTSRSADVELASSSPAAEGSMSRDGRKRLNSLNGKHFFAADPSTSPLKIEDASQAAERRQEVAGAWSRALTATKPSNATSDEAKSKPSNATSDEAKSKPSNAISDEAKSKPSNATSDEARSKPSPPPPAHGSSSPPPPWSFLPIEWNADFKVNEGDKVSQALKQLRQLPKPMLPGLFDLVAEECHVGYDAEPYTKNTLGFVWGRVGADRCLSGWHPGNSTDFVIDTRGPGGQPSAVILYHSKGSYSVGNALVTCISGCTCEPVELEGAERSMWGVQYYATVILPTAHECCTLHVEIIEHTESGGHNVRIKGFALSSELAAHPDRYPEFWFGEDMQRAPPLMPKRYLVYENTPPMF